MTLPGEHPVDVSLARDAAQMATLKRQVESLVRANSNSYLRAEVTTASAGMADSTWVRAPLVDVEDPLGMLSGNVITVPESGLWLVSGHVSLNNPTNAGGPFRASFVRTSPSAVTHAPYNHIGSSPGASWAREIPLAASVVRLAVNDTCELQAMQIGGGTTTQIVAGTRLDMLLIGP